MRTFAYVAREADEGRLIKRVIRASMGLSHRQFSLLKREGGLLLDGVSVHANAVVHAGQTITCTLIEEGGIAVAPEDEPVRVVFEDDDLLIVDKEAPLACQSSPKQPDNTLENRLTHVYGPGYVFRPINRLDKGTSGLMAVAKNAHAQMLASRALHTDAFVREYLAVLDGVPQPPDGEVALPIGKADGATVRRAVRADGKPARTLYHVLESRNGHALVRIRLDTGRTHQIRVHMAALGCPVHGDFLYGAEDKDRLPGRFALHAARLELLHPQTGEHLAFESELPPELHACL